MIVQRRQHFQGFRRARIEEVMRNHSVARYERINIIVAGEVLGVVDKVLTDDEYVLGVQGFHVVPPISTALPQAASSSRLVGYR